MNTSLTITQDASQQDDLSGMIGGMIGDDERFPEEEFSFSVGKGLFAGYFS